MKILLVPSPDTTSLNIVIRCLSIAAEAMRQSHQVAIIAPRKLIERFDHLKLTVFECLPPPRMSQSTAEVDPIKKFADYADLIGTNDRDYIEHCLAVESEAIRRFRPDVIYSDVSLTAWISARVAGLPIASLCNLTWTPPYLIDELADGPTGPDGITESSIQSAGLNAVLVQRGLPAVRDVTDLLYFRSDLKLVPSTPLLEVFPAEVTGLEYIGYLYSDALEPSDVKLEFPSDRINLLVYMGIGDITPEMMARVLPVAFDGTGYHVHAVMGDYFETLPASTSNVSFVRFLPLYSALRRTSLAIFHGGSGLVMTCLLQGVPGLMYPCGVYEREFHAETMARVGAGRVCYTQQEFNAKEVRAQVDAVLQTDMAAKAKQFGESLRALGGPRRAVQLLETLARSRSVVSTEMPALNVAADDHAAP